MLKTLAIFAVIAAALLLCAAPGFCSASRSVIFHFSVTIPEHVVTHASPAVMALQVAQTQTVVRNNKTIRLMTIVVP